MQEDFDALHAEFASLSVQHGERIGELERQIAEESPRTARSTLLPRKNSLCQPIRSRPDFVTPALHFALSGTT